MKKEEKPRNLTSEVVMDGVRIVSGEEGEEIAVNASVLVRAAEPTDYPALAGFYEKWGRELVCPGFEEGPAADTSCRQYARRFMHPKGNTRIAIAVHRDSGEILGASSMRMDKGEDGSYSHPTAYGEFGGCLTHPWYRGQGINHALVNNQITHGRMMGLNVFQLETALGNTALRASLTGKGWKETGETTGPRSGEISIRCRLTFA